MIEVKEISVSATYPVRNAVLRKGKPIESCIFPGDDLPSTKHFGIVDDVIMGVVSWYDNSNRIFEHPSQIQIRAMAILEEYQGLRLGEKLLLSCEEYLKTDTETLIWFNARESALGFYRKLGYETIGAAFDIKGVGEHYVMFKKLSV